MSNNKKITNFIPQEILNEEYFFKHLSMFMKESYGIKEQVQFLTEWLKSINSMCLYLPKVLDIWNEDYKKELLKKFGNKEIERELLAFPYKFRGEFIISPIKISNNSNIDLYNKRVFLNIASPQNLSLFEFSEEGNYYYSSLSEKFINDKNYYVIMENASEWTAGVFYEYQERTQTYILSKDGSKVEGKKYYRFSQASPKSLRLQTFSTSDITDTDTFDSNTTYINTNSDFPNSILNPFNAQLYEYKYVEDKYVKCSENKFINKKQYYFFINDKYINFNNNNKISNENVREGFLFEEEDKFSISNSTFYFGSYFGIINKKIDDNELLLVLYDQNNNAENYLMSFDNNNNQYILTNTDTGTSIIGYKISNSYIYDETSLYEENPSYKEFKILDIIASMVGCSREYKIFIPNILNSKAGKYETFRLSNVDLLDVIKINIIKNNYKGTLQELIDIYKEKLNYSIYISQIPDSENTSPKERSAACNIYLEEVNSENGEAISNYILKLFKYSDLFIESVGVTYNKAIITEIDTLLTLDKEYTKEGQMALYYSDSIQESNSIVLG